MSKIDTSLPALTAEYNQLWAEMKIRPEYEDALAAGVKKILEGKDQYLDVQVATAVPWWFTGLVHKMESNCDFSRHLHNGDPLTRRTRQVPRGRPKTGKPPFTWQASAIDALEMKGFQNTELWDLPRVAWSLERYNGWGYRKYHPDTLSPYLWSYSSHYTAGKYVADGKWDRSAVSRQAGALALLRRLMEADDSVRFEEDTSEWLNEFPKTEEPVSKKEMRKKSRKWRLLDWLKSFFTVGALGTGGALSADNIQATSRYMDTVKAFAASHGWILLILGCAGGFLLTMIVQKHILNDAEEGRYTPSGDADAGE